MDSRRFETFRAFAPIAVSAAMALFAPALHASSAGRVGRLPEIDVHNVEELYAAVYNTPGCPVVSTCRVTIRLAPGTYALSPSASWGGVPHPYKGSLRLRPGMSLVGSEEHVDTNGDGVPDPIDPASPDVFAVPGTETTIDGSLLVLPFEQRTDCAGEFRFFPDPVIYVGRDNTIAGLTVVAGDHVGIGEPTNDRIAPDGSLSIEITDAVLDGFMTYANSECAARHAHSVLNISHSVVRGGLLIQNFYTGDASDDPKGGPTIRATLAFNLFYQAGMRAAAGDEGTDGGFVMLHTVGNVFRESGGNLQLRGAVGRDGLRTVGNRLVVISESDTFGESPHNIFLTVGEGLAVGNSVKAEFFDSRFIRDSPDTPPEFQIIGGNEGGDEGGASDNHASILITGATVETSDGVAVEGGLSITDEIGSGDLSNTARLEGTRRNFLMNNQGLPAPPEHFFLGQ
jgi:hypothetical protein